MIGIYKITNKLNNKIYIGQSIHILQRWEEHKYQECNSAIHQAIKKYGIDNFTFEIIEECDQSLLDEKEIYWIKYYNSYKEGYNLTPGGRFACCFDIMAIKDLYENYKSMNTTAKIIGCSENTVRRILHSLDIYNNECQTEKAIDKIDPKTFSIITTYDSLTQAAISEKVSLSAISMVINGKTQSCNGFLWKLHDAPISTIKNNKVKKAKRKVSQYDKNYNLLHTYDSLMDAARALGKKKSATNYIRQSCNNKDVSAYGYFWQYA